MSDAASQTTGAEAQPQGTPEQKPTAIPGASAQPNDQAGSAIKDAAAEARRRLKIDNEEIDEDEVIKVYKDRKGHQSAANKILQEGKAAKKQAEEFVKMMKDPAKLKGAMEKLGYTREQIRKMSEEILAAELEDELMDPREKDLRDAKAKLKSYEDMERQEKEAVEKRRDEDLKAKYSKEYSEQFIDALKSERLPPTKQAVADMAKYVHRAAKMNFKMTPLEAAKLVKEDIETAHRNLYGEADPETLVRLLGDQGLSKIRGYDSARIKKPEDMLKTPQNQGEPRQRNSNGSRMTPKEWREFNRK